MKRLERCPDCEEILRGDSPNPESAHEWYEAGNHVCHKDKEALKRITLEAELRSVLNRHSAENGSNTPDFILARYLLGCLSAWNMATLRREEWYGRPVQHGVFEKWLLDEGVTRAACDACGQESANPGAAGEKCMLNKCPGTYRAVVPR